MIVPAISIAREHEKPCGHGKPGDQLCTVCEAVRS